MSAKNVYVQDLVPGQQFRDIFALAEARLLQAKNGPYWSLVLQDGSGRIAARIWSPHSQRYEGLAPGQIVRVLGKVETFRDTNQIAVDTLELIEEDLEFAEYSTLIPTSATDPDELLDELEALLKETLTYKPWKDFVRRVMRDEEIRWRLKAAPAAKAIHHAYAGGLLEHTLAVCRLCMSLADLYPDLDREVLLLGAAFHDMGKAWELGFGLTSDYTDEGRLLGHIVLALEVLTPHMKKVRNLDEELIQHLKHLIVSHHGEYGFGSPRRPKTAEALVLHYADQIDSKLNVAREAFADQGPEDESVWSSYVRSLERFLFKPRATPTATPKSRTPAKKNDRQLCLLPSKE